MRHRIGKTSTTELSASVKLPRREPQCQPLADQILAQLKRGAYLLMKRWGLSIGAIIGVAGLLLSLNIANAAGDANDEAAIRGVENGIMAATSADEIMKYYDANNVDLFDCFGPLQFHGATAVHGAFDGFCSNVKDVKGQIVEMAVVTDGKLGMVRSIQHFTFTHKDGKAGEATIRLTDVLHKAGGAWKVIHQHVSVPLDPSTGQGQMNLTS
jgi:ketosteroid isomerase-like protein